MRKCNERFVIVSVRYYQENLRLSSLRLLRRVQAEMQHQDMEDVYWCFQQSTNCSDCCFQDILCSWRLVAVSAFHGWYKTHPKANGCAGLWSTEWPFMVGSIGHCIGLGGEWARRKLLFWQGRHQRFLGALWYGPDLPSTYGCGGWIRVLERQDVGYCFQRTKLLRRWLDLHASHSSRYLIIFIRVR